MNITKNLNKIIDIAAAIAFISILLIFSNGSLLIIGIIPILLSIALLDYGINDFLLILIGSFLAGLLITDIKSLAFIVIPLFVISILFIFLVKSNIKDKNQIIISFVVISLLLIAFYMTDMIREGFDIDQMALTLKESMDANFNYDIPIEAYRISFSMFPSILASLSLLYSIFSLKVIRNYLHYKKKASDMKRLNTIRIDKKDFIIIVISVIIIYIASLFMNVSNEYISANLIMMMSVIFILNGLSLYDYMIMKNKSMISKGIQRILILIFRYFFAAVFAIFGIADVFMDVRNKVRRPSARI